MTKRVVAFLFLLFFAACAFADSSGSLDTAKSFGMTLVPPETDVSTAYLGMIFGTVGNTLQGTGGQILGQMFAVFNKGVLVAAALWLAMTALQLVLKSAYDGQFSQHKPATIFLRIALGFALILPSSTTGYSILQDIYMKVVLAGVALADDTWNAAINYMQYGGQLYIPPNNISNTSAAAMWTSFVSAANALPTNYNQTTSENSSFPQLAVATQIFQNEVCMLRSGSRAWNALQTNGQLKQYSYETVEDPASGVIYFPGVGNQNTTTYSTTSPNATCGYVKTYCALNSQNCGGLTSLPGYDGTSGSVGATSANAQKAIGQTTQNATHQQLEQDQTALQAAQNQLMQLQQQCRPGSHNSNCSQQVAQLQQQIRQLQTTFESDQATGNMADATATGNPSTAMEWNYAWLAMKQLVQSLMPAAQNYVDQYPPLQNDNYAANIYPAQDPDGVVATNAKTFLTAAIAYGNLAAPLQNLVTASGGSTLSSVNQSLGWIMAGAYYWDIESANNASAQASLVNLLPSAQSPMPINLPVGNASNGVPINGISEMIRAATDVIGGTDPAGGAYTGYHTNFMNDWSNYSGVALNAVTTDTNAELGAMDSGDSDMNLIGKIIGGIGISWNSTSLGVSGYNPIVVVMQQGSDLINFIAELWAGGITVSFALGLASGICTSISPGGAGFQSILIWVKSILMLLTGMLLLPGMIFSYYVPLYPFAVFTFAVIGWVAMVVEGMAAAPLICVGITHPEGHDFLGKAEQSLMFFLGIFVRPALLVIGLIASMLVSFVAFNILMSGYALVEGSLASAPAPGVGGLASIFVHLIKMCLSLLIISFLVVEIIEQSFKLTYQIPQYVMKWIGGPEMGQDYGGMASQIKSQMSPIAQSMGTFSSQSHDGAASGGGELGKTAGNAITGGGGGGGDSTSNTAGGGGPAAGGGVPPVV